GVTGTTSGSISITPVVGSSDSSGTSSVASVVSGIGSGSGPTPPAKAVVEKAAKHSITASVAAKERMIFLFFIGIVLLFKLRLRGWGCLQSATAYKGGKFLRRHVQAAHKLDDLQIFLFGLCRFQLPKLLLQLRDLGLGFLNIPFDTVKFVGCHRKTLLSGVKVDARNSKDVAASSLTLSWCN